MADKELITAVAKAIARSEGHDPDHNVVRGIPYQISGRTFAAVGDHAAPEPLWRTYYSQAEAAVAAVGAYLSSRR